VVRARDAGAGRLGVCVNAGEIVGLLADPDRRRVVAGGAPDQLDARAIREARVLRSFVRDGRITQIPMQHAKRRVLLEWLGGPVDTAPD